MKRMSRSLTPSGSVNEGFTLIELLVVIAIIAILAAILFPVFAKAREKARQTTCLNNAKQIATSLLMWVQDHDEAFPPATTWVTELAASYGVTGKVWDCPSSALIGTESAPDYFYVGGSFLAGGALGDVHDPVAAPILADLMSGETNKPYIADDGANDVYRAVQQVDMRHNEGAVFAYVDGHLAWLAKSAVTPLLFVPSIIGADFTKPVSAGLLYPSGGGLGNEPYNTLASYGMTTLVGSYWVAAGGKDMSTVFTEDNGTQTVYYPDGNTTQVNEPGGGWTGYISGGKGVPSWWKTGDVNSTNLYHYLGWPADFTPMAWGGKPSTAMSPYYLRPFLGNSGSTPTPLTIIPNGNGSAVRTLAFVLGNNAGNYLTINSITIGGAFTGTPKGGTLTGGTTYTSYGSGQKFVSLLTAGTQNALVLLLPCHAGVPIRITYSITAASGYALYLAVEP